MEAIKESAGISCQVMVCCFIKSGLCDKSKNSRRHKSSCVKTENQVIVPGVRASFSLKNGEKRLQSRLLVTWYGAQKNK